MTPTPEAGTRDATWRGKFSALARVYTQIIGMASASFDVDFLHALPSLTPFVGLSPAIRHGELNLRCTCYLCRQVAQAREGWLEILARMAEPGGIGLSPATIGIWS